MDSRMGTPVAAPPGYVQNQFVHPATVQYTTTTTTTTTSPSASGIRFNPNYFVTPPGILKIIQVIFAVVCFSCASPVLYGFAGFLVFVASVAFTSTLFLCSIYLFSVREWLSTLPWLTMELIYTIGACGFYLLASIIQLAYSTTSDYSNYLNYFNQHGAYVAAGVFGLFCAVLYGFGSFFLFTEYKQSRVIRGQVVQPAH